MGKIIGNTQDTIGNPMKNGGTLAGTTTIFYALTVLLMGNQMKNMGKDRKSA